MIQTTYGPQPQEKIKEFQACYVFSPNKCSDKNKVALSLMPGAVTLGIGKIETILKDFADNKIEKDIVIYPYGVPIADSLSCHELLSRMQIGRVWRQYEQVGKNTMMNLHAICNVMEHFIFYGQ